MLINSVAGHWVTLHGFVAMSGLGVYAIASRTRRQRRHPSAAIAWVIALALLPYAALPLYLLVGNRKVLLHSTRSIQLAPSEVHRTDVPTAMFEHLGLAMGLPPAMSYGLLEIHPDGQAALQSLRLLISQAAHTLDVCTFLIGNDALGKEIIDALTRKAQEGVRVRLLIDGVGIYLGGKPNLRRLIAAGAAVELFASPLRSPLQRSANLRNHRKLVIADGQRTWAGGRNLAAEYFVGDATAQPAKVAWIDLSFVFSGDLARQAQYQFDQDWAFVTRASPLKVAEPLIAESPFTRKTAQFIASGPDQLDDTLYSLLVSSCFSAKRRILAVSPYFVPDATFLMALTLAARRGVKVDVVLPLHSNHRLADVARHSALREMSAAGAGVWMLSTMIHAKAIIIDDELALAGSANLDERSFFLNYELMIAFFEASEVEHFAKWIDVQKNLAVRYLPRAPSVLREFGEGLVRWVAFQL